MIVPLGIKFRLNGTFIYNDYYVFVPSCAKLAATRNMSHLAQVFRRSFPQNFNYSPNIRSFDPKILYLLEKRKYLQLLKPRVTQE
jgi:hypothetical protein